MTDLGVSNYPVYTDVLMRCMYQGHICFMRHLGVSNYPVYKHVVIKCMY